MGEAEGEVVAEVVVVSVVTVAVVLEILELSGREEELSNDDNDEDGSSELKTLLASELETSEGEVAELDSEPGTPDREVLELGDKSVPLEEDA